MDWRSRQDLRRRRRLRLGKARQQRWRHRFTRLKRAVVAILAIMIAAMVAGLLMSGLGVRAIILIFLATIVTFAVLAIFPRTPRPRRPDPDRADLGELADQTAHWLETQRAYLPARAQHTLDLIGAHLEQLSRQLAARPAIADAAPEIRKLVGVHLPALVNSFTSLPPGLHDQPSVGSTPENQLGEGLDVIARELDTVTSEIARNELDALAIRGRYLETRYVRTDDD